jgi:hypothetical protein
MPFPLVPLVPPPVHADSALRWLFVRAFAAPAALAPQVCDGARVAEYAHVFDLTARLVSRRGLQGLAAELGRPAALGLFAAQARAAGRAEARARLAERVACEARALALPFVWLKAGALVRRGRVAAGARPAGDVDLLVPRAGARALAERLCARGLRPCDVPAEAHQLKPLTDGRGGVLDIHVLLPGLRDPADGAPLTYESLSRHGALEALGDRALEQVPRPDVLLAHAVAHALVQNAGAPHVACPTRLLADVIDLGVLDDVACCARAEAWLGPLLVPEALPAVRRLASLLAQADPALWIRLEQGADEADVRLLRHVLAGQLDQGYRARLRAHAALGPPGARWSAWRRALVLDDAQVVALYGRPRGRAGYLLRRLGRPFDLALRLVRARAAGVLRSRAC